jgi:hypothetical protein
MGGFDNSTSLHESQSDAAPERQPNIPYTLLGLARERAVVLRFRGVQPVGVISRRIRFDLAIVSTGRLDNEGKLGVCTAY